MITVRALDFAAPSRTSAWAVLAFVAAFVALVWLGAVAAAWHDHRSQVQALHERLARAQAASRPPARPAPPPLDAEQQRDVLQAALELGSPWGPLLDHLARQAHRNIALTQLAPDARAGTLLIVGAASTPEAALSYARRLAGGTVLADVQLLSHEVAPSSAGQRLPTTFRIGARWARPGP